ncbi:uncharacterized protein YkwD, partial [Undibacterium sp. GrIS 1.2]|uniref:CAP domain-containing protein n=1 Tax=Undibacterium sp. GrIS 1.2 TaxID=3143933 RepID=UPI003398FC7E
MKTSKITVIKMAKLSSMAVALILTACGGGEGSSSTTTTTPPLATTCANGGTNFPTCTAPTTAAQLQLTVSAPPLAAGSQELAAFNYLNQFRHSLGLGLLAYSAPLTLASKNHANYLVLNQSLTHTEDPSKPGFTGVTDTDRANFAGYATNYFVSAGGSVANTMPGAIQALINTVYHRGTLIRQSWTDQGMTGYCYGVCDASNSALYLNVAQKTVNGQTNASDFVMMYPMDKQSNVNLTTAGDNINPFPDITGGVVYGKVGYPVSFAVEANQMLVLKDFTMTEAGTSAPLNAYVYTASNDPNNLIPSNEAWLTAKSQLKPSTTYNMALHGSINGNEFGCAN